MKKYIVNEFCHIKLINDDSKHSKDIVIDNFANQIKELKVLNKEWYNIYKTFNTFFDWKRQESNINQLKAIFVDIDYDSIEEKEDFITIRKKCKVLQDKYWIFPYEINETYKWYHILYAIDESLWYLENNIYLDVSEALIGYFNGDTKAKQITGLYKVVWFIDNKDWRNFKIINKYSATETSKNKYSINKKTLEEFGSIEKWLKYKDILKNKIYWSKVKYDNEWDFINPQFSHEKTWDLEKLYKAIDKKSENREVYNLIENIDARVFIDKINEYDKWHIWNSKVIVKWKSIDGTDWLKLFYNNWKWEIKDFSSNKNRFWNRLFLINHVLDINSDNKHKKDKLLNYLSFFRESFWITFNKKSEKFYLSWTMVYNYLNKSINIPDDIINKYADIYNIKSPQIKNSKNLIDNIIYIYSLIEKLRQLEYDNIPNFNIPYTNILDILWLKNSYENRNKLKFILHLWSMVNITNKYYNKQWNEITKRNKIYWVKLSKKNFDYHSLLTFSEMASTRNGLLKISQEILFSKWFTSKNDFKFFLYILFSTKNFSNFKLTLNQVVWIIWDEKSEYKDKAHLIRKVNKYLSYMKEKKVIMYYNRTNTTYKIGKNSKK